MAQAVAHGMYRQMNWYDMMFVVIGGTLFALLPAKQASPGRRAYIGEPRFAER